MNKIILPDEILKNIKEYLSYKEEVILFHDNVVCNIISFLPYHEQMLINNNYYKKIEDQIKIKPKYYDQFLMQIIKNNYFDLYKKHIKLINSNAIFRSKQYLYKKNKFKNLLELLKFIGRENNANKIVNELINIQQYYL